jgi:hypothetical protein
VGHDSCFLDSKLTWPPPLPKAPTGTLTVLANPGVCYLEYLFPNAQSKRFQHPW